ncbi:MAG: DUF3833 family protein [Gammaproteobacteria bacterium]|nr:DUF3833 family protein [Gammaproteobacteria bacterium]
MLNDMKISLVALLLLLLGCQAQNIEDYALQRPLFDPQAFYSGHLSGWGMYTDRSGVVRQRFRIEMEAAWQQDLGKLQQTWRYSTGKVAQRIVTLKKLDEHRYRIAASDAQSQGEGRVAGNSAYWNYRFSFDDGSEVAVRQVEQWSYAIDANSVMQKISLKKYGLPMGELTVFVQRTLTLDDAVEQVRDSVEQMRDYLFGRP